METVCTTITVTATPRVHQHHRSIDEGPKYQANQVTTAVNCSLESFPDLDPSDWVVDLTSKHGLSGYLQNHALTTVAPTTVINQFRMMRRRYQLSSAEHRQTHNRKESGSPVLTVLLTKEKRGKRHRKVTSLVHNPLSTGLAKVKARQLQTGTCPLALGPMVRPVAKTPHQKRSISVAQDVKTPKMHEYVHTPNGLKLSGIALTPERLKSPHKPSPRTRLFPYLRTVPL